MKTLTVFYDAHCGLCSQVRGWLSRQPAYVRLEFVPYDSPEAAHRLPSIRHLQADQEIVVMADSGEVWQGGGAWVTCLWALKEYRAWSARLANPAMQRLARGIVHSISQHRYRLSYLMGFQSDAEILRLAQGHESSRSPRVLHDLDLID
ncbi:thiol-disulfide oxidoreductase DCC family protein [Prosthecobacter dejongeii]|uniref:Putative DCC family thiol-disulfide oxidoreductase YuxK n=1 Tax=Prosthecobacter dejongeii TaxID=48465 RepID=A0A7W7YHX3_9BACT|nr:DUF393 domain-containing protein [Prosthecobacter dejongeii]MBB5036429.1 putative DCC family thiol-disulfide oxidoreductase YuxK [Prosthecobacter dejongeii]